MKLAAKPYSGGEKDGVHAISLANPDVIDLEVAFNGEAEEENERVTQRIDLACFEEVEGKLRLRFWEAKLYRNPALFAEGETDAPVVGQVKGYLKLIEQHRKEIVDSYRAVARNLAETASWGGVKSRKIGKLVERVANDEAVVIDEPPFVGLIVYDYDDPQFKSPRWKTHMDKIKKENIFIQSRGKAKGMKLRGPRLASKR
jgi:diphthamide synthase (EF-2-diphthine--ammonia ligase)